MPSAGSSAFAVAQYEQFRRVDNRFPKLRPAPTVTSMTTAGAGGRDQTRTAACEFDAPIRFRQSWPRHFEMT